jgi:hypothetical protein
MKKTICVLCCLLLLASGLPLLSATGNQDHELTEVQRWVFTHDCLPSQLLPSSSPRNGPPGYPDTSEYLIGSIALGVVLLESNGSIDPNLENWTTTEIAKVRSEINESLAWLSSQNIDANITSVTDYHLCPTSYEPIIHPSVTDPTWQQLWATEAMADLGYTQGNYWQRTRDYINDIRVMYHTDWAYMIFVVDSSADSDGYFSDMYCAYAYLGGPFLVMTYDNGPYGVEDMAQVCRHESSHIFYATDEYNGITEYSGYLNEHDIEGADCIMYNPGSNNICSGTRLQYGWRDIDGDGIQDIVDTNPETILDPWNNLTVTFTGTAYDVAYPNQNPGGPGNDVTINTINMVLYRVDGGSYTVATPSDGTWDEWQEDYSFDLVLSTPGVHHIEVVAVNSIGNYDPTPANATITIGSPPSPPIITGPTNGKIRVPHTYTFISNDSNGGEVSFLIDWGDGTMSDWLGPVPSGTPLNATHTWTAKGSYTIKAMAKNAFGTESEWGSLPVTMPLINPVFSIERTHHPILQLLYWIFTWIIR